MKLDAAGTSNQTLVSMTFQTIVNNSRTRLAHARTSASGKVRGFIYSRPLASAGILLFTGLLLGAGGRSAAGMAQLSRLRPGMPHAAAWKPGSI